MDKTLLQKVKRHVSMECANHQNKGPTGILNFCWNRETTQKGICNYFLPEPKTCTYFLTAVLPINPELEDEINENRGTDRGGVSKQVPESVKGNPKRVPPPGSSVSKIGKPGVLRRG